MRRRSVDITTKINGVRQERQAAYRKLFKHHISERDINEIRKATNKAWALGSTQFKQRIKSQLARPVQPRARGGDRKSKEFQRARINRV